MRENECQRIVEKLRSVTLARENGRTCPEALVDAYREELGENYASTAELIGTLPAAIRQPDLCDIFAVTAAIIARLTGAEDGGRTIGRLRREYGSSGCGSDGRDTAICTMRMKDCVLMIQRARAEMRRYNLPECGQ